MKEMGQRGELAVEGGHGWNQYRGSSKRTTTLKDLGIRRDQSSKWQKMAEMAAHGNCVKNLLLVY